ncbi:MAG: DEAD/DEAH box helicase family protein [Dehalococcoidia bacterium]|nr:DEAD/DEAH box helicase family protein [Dehalococcoidia bacterium]
MSDVTIENPILNSPYEEPRRHFRFEEDGITNDVVETRRVSSYFMPIAATKKKGKQLAFDTEWTKDRVEENKFINRVRGRVAQWRSGGYTGITKTTRQLLEYWQRPERGRRLFFCQIEAMETAIYIAEVASKFGDSWIENDLRNFNEDANPLLYRIAIKMATGSGKTVVMAMLVAWHVLNKKANTQDARFTDAFLIVTPGITIKDRLRVLLPNDPANFYRAMDIVPADWLTQLQETKIIITNFHTLRPKERGDAARLTKQILNAGETSAFTETPGQMARRVCRDLGSKKNIIIINDEAHHCYRRRAGGETAEEALKGEDRREAEKREEEARIWISGLEAIKAKIGVKVVYDLSATPFFLRGSGYQEGTLFPWVVSDFSLIDAIESGIVKVPRVPVADDAMQREGPMYRDLWLRIRAGLPKKGRKTEEIGGEPKLPVELEGALKTLFDHYKGVYALWADDPHARENSTPPVFIVVCQNTNISKRVFDWVGGWTKKMPDGNEIVVPGALDLFSNEQNGGWSARPSTILVDSTQLESDEAMSAEFKKIAAAEIEKFKWEYKARTGRDPEELTDKDILREVMNTVGKKGKLGENVKCVVSVSMLTEGWDANTVTHILGVRAFGTQLLCEQVIGRGLRRRSYVLNDDGHFDPEYAEVYGVPFSFIPCAGAQKQPRLGAVPTRVKALEERAHLEITFPRLVGYRYELPGEKLTATFTEDSVRVLSTEDIPTKTENAPIVGETVIMTLDDLKQRRDQEVAFLLAKRTLEKYFRDEDGNVRQWLFPQLLGVARRWLAECVRCKDNTFPQLLLLVEFADDAAGRIYRAIVASTEGQKTLMPVLTPYDTIGSTRYVDFDTTKATYQTNAEKCHVSHVVCDSNWEAKMAQSLEDMDEVVCYVKNENPALTIPYTLDGQEKSYLPDFIVRLDDGHGSEDLLNLIIEVTGEKRKDKETKSATAKTMWVPAVNNHGGFGRWAYIEDFDPWNAQNAIREFLVTA